MFKFMETDQREDCNSCKNTDANSTFAASMVWGILFDLFPMVWILGHSHLFCVFEAQYLSIAVSKYLLYVEQRLGFI